MVSLSWCCKQKDGIKLVDVEVFDKPRTSVRGTLRASKSPKQTTD